VLETVASLLTHNWNFQRGGGLKENPFHLEGTVYRFFRELCEILLVLSSKYVVKLVKKGFLDLTS